jgi:hypothetical protein
MMTPLESLSEGFEGRIGFREKRPNLLQIIAPIFHEDGDMIDLFLDLREGDPFNIRLTDGGLTLMRLSYTFDIDTPNKQRILNRILSENQIELSRGELTLRTKPESVFPGLLAFAQVIAKVTSLSFLKRQVISSLFYEMLDDFIRDELSRFSPRPRYSPIGNRPELEVDWLFPFEKKPIFLFGVKDSSKARLAAISCLEFQRQEIPFRSIVVHEDFEDGLRKSDQRIITSAADKQFTSLEDFAENGPRFFAREAA